MSISILTLARLCSKLWLVSQKQKLTKTNKNISLFAALKVARAVSQSQRVVSAKILYIGRIYYPRLLGKNCCGGSRSFYAQKQILMRTIKIVGACSIILLLILVATDPQGLPSILLVTPFVLIFIILLAILSIVLRSRGMSEAGRLRLAILGAVTPVFLLIMKSLGQLTLRDTLAIFALFAVAYFYTSRFGVQPTGRSG